MTELERARAHLLYCQEQLARARAFKWVGEYTKHVEGHFLSALSWVWEEQEKEDIVRIGADRESEIKGRLGFYYKEYRDWVSKFFSEAAYQEQLRIGRENRAMEW